MDTARNATIIAAALAALSLTACSSGGDAEPGETVTVTEGATSGGATRKGAAPEGGVEGGGATEGDATGAGATGGATSGGSSSGGASQGGGGSRPQEAPRGVDIVKVGEALTKKGWVDCDRKPTVDMAGFRKVGCIVPDRYAAPGQDGNAVYIIEMDSFDTADAYAEYASGNTRMLDGVIFDGATGKAVNGAIRDAGDLVQEFDLQN